MKANASIAKIAFVGRISLCASISLLTNLAFPQANVTTFHNDIARTGLNPNETILTPSNVGSSSFGLLFSLPVDGQVYAQPLYMPHLDIPGNGTHNVVFVATEQNSVYAFDADSNNGANSAPLWHVNLGTPVPWGDIGSESITPNVGITSTPVIMDPPHGTPVIFVVAETKSVDSSGNPVYAQTLHALSVTTGAEQPGSPIVIQGSVPGVGDGSSGGVLSFDPLIHIQRASLLLTPAAHTSTDSLLYVTFASLGDLGNYHGWVFVYDANKLTLKGIFNASPNAASRARAGIWAGGAGPSSDGANVFMVTGNGDFNPSVQDWGDSVLKLNPNNLTISDYFTPSDQSTLDDYDTDLGSGIAVLLPISAGGTSGKHLLVQAGKNGTIYLLDANNLGKNGTSNNVVQQLTSVIGGVFGSPAYFNNTVFFGPSNSPIVAFPISNGLFTSTSPIGYSPETINYPGSTPSISANGTTNGIVWDLEARDFFSSATTSILHAFDAKNLATELYDSSQTDDRDVYGGAVKFATPTIVNGKVYAGAAGGVGVFGLGVWPVAPGISPAAGTYEKPPLVTISDGTSGSTIYYTLDGSNPTPSSLKYTEPFTLNASATINAKAFFGNEEGSVPTLTNYLVDPSIGSGTGLTGSYYAGQQTNPTGTPTATRVDPTINFDWNGASPIAGVAGTDFAVVWTGSVQAETTATYTFTTQSDDGVQVSIGNQLLINDYTQHGDTADTATFSMVKGQTYPITIKYFQGTGTDLIQLSWQAPGLPKQIVPKSQLYPQ